MVLPNTTTNIDRIERSQECIVCEAIIDFDSDLEIGELLMCPDCGTELEVRFLNPLKIIEAPMEEEDWGQ
ncbi:MAG: lysine biosynthesis protein LysW [Candidatus Hodarchaeota archaeon]